MTRTSMFVLRAEDPALDTSPSGDVRDDCSVLGALSSVVGGEAVTSCLFSLGWGGGGPREPFVFIESGRFYFTQYIEDNRGSVSFSVWVRFVITSLCFETVCDAVWLLLGVLSFFFRFCF